MLPLGQPPRSGQSAASAPGGLASDPLRQLLGPARCGGPRRPFRIERDPAALREVEQLLAT
jgi:hypothetical protein